VTVGRFWGEAARYLADSLILPLNASQYADALEMYVKDLEAGYGTLMNENSIKLGNLMTDYIFHLNIELSVKYYLAKSIFYNLLPNSKRGLY